jgi:hypothetical protein
MAAGRRLAITLTANCVVACLHYPSGLVENFGQLTKITEKAVLSIV